MKKLFLFPLFGLYLNATPIIPMESDKIYILDFFASWCSSCEKELPVLSKLNESYKKNGIELVGIDIDKKESDGIKFQQKMAKYINFKVINDSTNEIIATYKPIGMPALYVMKNQKVCGKIFGATDDLENRLNTLIESCKGR